MLSTRIDFVAPPFAGHLFPLLDLAGQLRSQGFSNLRILSTPESRRAVELTELPLVPLLEGRSHIIFQISDTPQKVGSNPFRMYEQLKLNLGLMQDLRNQLQNEWTVNRPELVVADFTVPIAGLLAQSMGIRWWTSMPSPCVFETGDGTPSYLGGWMPPVSAAGRLRDAAGRLAIRTFKNSFHWLFRRRMRELGIERIYREDFTETIYSADTVLAPGLRELEFPRSWPDNMVFIGPLTGSPPFPHEPPEFIADRPHVLISLGTHLWWAKERAQQLMQSVAEQMPEIVFHFTRGHTGNAAHPSRAGNFQVYDYVPYDQYLHRYQSAIIHGGTGIMYSCLKHGVPTLVWPQDYDQFDHAARLIYHQLAIRCEPTVSAVVRDLNQLMNDTAIHQRIDRMKQLISEQDAAADFIRRLRPSLPVS
jgi:UDP:flavonoid glycosyltransferase YjiC (YdhE family)